MDVSIFIAKIIGPLFLVVAVGIMLNRAFYQRVMEDYSKNAAVIFFTGVAPLVFGIAIVILHNVWAANWPVIITIFGWGGIIKGTWLIVFPNTVARFMKVYEQNKTLLVVHLVIAIFFGAILTVFGYFLS